MTHIQELTITKPLRATLEPQQVAEILYKHGWRMLGMGLEAAVAEHPHRPDYVLKVFPTHSKYTKFVEFVRKNHHNPHLPTFSRYVRPIPGTTWSYVRMEKLTPVLDIRQLIDQHLPEIISLYAAGKKHDLNTVGLDITPSLFKQLKSKGYTRTQLEDPKILDKIYADTGAPPAAWVTMVDRLVQLGHALNLYGLDLHQGNMMLRNHTLVITDPFV